MAVAPKPQAHLYNAWFQEIYMGTRESNPDGTYVRVRLKIHIIGNK